MYTLKITRAEYDGLLYEQNKEYVAGYLMGRLTPIWTVDKKKITQNDLDL